VPLKLRAPRRGKTPNYEIRGTYLGVRVEVSSGTHKRSVADHKLKETFLIAAIGERRAALSADSGTDRIRPLADSKQATNKKNPPDGDQRAGPIRIIRHPWRGRRKRDYHQIRGEPSPGLKFNVSCRARHSAQIAPKTASA
jgi:hypothetical protein